MYPLGHIGIALFLAVLFSIPAAFVVSGVLLPDIVDKLFFTAGVLPCGRSFGHSLIFGPILGLATLAMTRNVKFALAIFFGAYLHLLGDVRNFIPWFYPFVEYEFDCDPVEFALDEFLIAMEAVGLGLIILVLKYRSKVILIREKILRKLGR